MLSDKEFTKIEKALDNGTLKLRFLTDAEYAEAEKKWRQAKARQNIQPGEVLNA